MTSKQMLGRAGALVVGAGAVGAGNVGLALVVAALAVAGALGVAATVVELGGRAEEETDAAGGAAVVGLELVDGTVVDPAAGDDDGAADAEGSGGSSSTAGSDAHSYWTRRAS